MAGAVGATPDVIAIYRSNRPGASPGDLLAALLTDRFFLLPALAVAEARGQAATYFYEFAWRHPAVGAGHGLDVPFVFDNLAAEGAELVAGPDAPQDLAQEMHASWARFASLRAILAGRRTTGPPGPGLGCRRRQRQQRPRSGERTAWPQG